MTHDQLYKTMEADYRARTGVCPDAASDIAIRFHVLADALEALYRQLDGARENFFPQTASGDALDRHAEMRGLSRKGAVCARGELLFSRADGAQGDISIPADTPCADTSGVIYLTDSPARILSGEASVLVPARAKTPGAGANSAPGRITAMMQAIAGIAAVTNPGAFTGGAPPETDDALRARIRRFDKAPPCGANAAFYRAAAENFPGISSAATVAGNAPHEVLVVVAQDGESDVPQSVCAALQTALAEQRAPCTTVQVLSAQAVPTDVSVLLKPADGCSFEQAQQRAESAIRQMLDQRAVGQRLSFGDLAALLLGTGCIENFRISAPAQDLSPATNQVLRAGTVRAARLGEAV